MPVPLSNPSLSLSICQSRDCTSFDITDTTGVYNSSSNPGGYGGANYDVTDVIDSRLEITLPDGTVVSINPTIVTAPITQIAQLNPPNIFGIAGNYAAAILQLGTITVSGSTGNDGTYTVLNTAFSLGFTQIEVSQVIPSAVVDGNIIFPYSSVYPALPDSSGLAPFTVTNSMLGLTGSLPDGIYTVKFEIDINNVFSQTQQTSVITYTLLTCTIKCCVDKLFAKISDQGCGCDDCDDKIVQNALLASALYQALCAAGHCGNTTQVDCLLDRLNKLCLAKGCGCN